VEEEDRVLQSGARGLVGATRVGRTAQNEVYAHRHSICVEQNGSGQPYGATQVCSRSFGEKWDLGG